MYLDAFHQTDGHITTITPEQGSAFAKEVSDDFNPLHNPDSKRFCVPGDLLFSLVLARFGLSKKMAFNYTGMVGKGVELVFPASPESSFSIQDINDKSYLNVERIGENTQDMELIENFSRAYVAFSGHSFPHILVPLMQAHHVMINPDKPMVIYESMAFEFNDLNAIQPTLELMNSSLEVTGKRGLVRMDFNIMESDTKIGEGFKTMILSGLREYDQTLVDGLIQVYEASKKSYHA